MDFVTVKIYLFLCSSTTNIIYNYQLLHFALEIFLYVHVLCSFLLDCFWYPSLANDNNVFIICRGHHLTMVKRGKDM